MPALAIVPLWQLLAAGAAGSGVTLWATGGLDDVSRIVKWTVIGGAIFVAARAAKVI